MLWRLAILVAVLAWLFLASPAILHAAERENIAVEVRNGTRTQNLARLTRTLLSQQGFNVVQIGNHIDFGAEDTVIYCRTEAETVARELQSAIFPGARIEESSKLKNDVDIKVLLGHDLLAQSQVMSRLLGDETEASPQAANAPKSKSRPQSWLTASKGTTDPVILSTPTKIEPSRPQTQPLVPTASSTANSKAVQSHTDARGVIHIGNVAPSRPNSPNIIPEGMTAQAEMTAPTVPKPEHLKTEEISAPESNVDAIQKACQALAKDESATPAYDVNGIIAAAGQAAAEKEAVDVVVDYNYLPVRKVSQDQGAIPALATQPAASKPAGTAAADGIRHYRDARGIVHISNMAPGAENLTPMLQMAQSPNIQGGEEKQPGQPAVPQPRPPIHHVAWNPDDRRLSILPITSSAKKAVIARPSLIRRYRDSKGMIHISNVDAEPRETSPPAGQMARNRSNEGIDPQAGRPVPAVAASRDRLAIRPAAWDGEGGIKLLKRVKATQSQTAEVTTDGGIRRYRDKQGIIHIKTVEYPLPPGVVLPPRQASASLLAPVAPAPASPPAVSNPPETATSPAPANPTAFGGAGAQITAFRDAKGRLRITTATPQPAPGRNFSPLPVYAELDPIILEAAQMHRLPPTLIKAVIKVESDFCSWAISPKGAMGLMQLMPGTANLLGVREPFNPRDNILGGCRYLRDLINLFGGNLPLALAAYNAGCQRVVNCGYQIPGIRETQDFVTAVMGRYVAEEKRGRQPWT